MKGPELYWLPSPSADWRQRVEALGTAPQRTWADVVALADTRLDFLRTNALDEKARRAMGDKPPAECRPLRLAVLGSCTLAHLHAGIRVAGWRRNLWITTYENAYGQYFQELVDPSSGLHDFRPDAVLFAFDARHLVTSALDEALQRIRRCWAAAREAFSCTVLQQTLLDGLAPLLGQNEHRLPGSPSAAVAALNSALRGMADAEGVQLVALDRQAAHDGLAAWHDASLWHRTKQDVLPTAAPRYGELVGRILAADRGLSKKCLVLALDD